MHKNRQRSRVWFWRYHRRQTHAHTYPSQYLRTRLRSEVTSGAWAVALSRGCAPMVLRSAAEFSRLVIDALFSSAEVTWLVWTVVADAHTLECCHLYRLTDVVRIHLVTIVWLRFHWRRYFSYKQELGHVLTCACLQLTYDVRLSYFILFWMVWYSLTIWLLLFA